MPARSSSLIAEDCQVLPSGRPPIRATSLDRPCMAMAMLVTVLVGVSRVYLGVHYPTDVLAGWLIGLCWALLCWMVERWLEHRAGLKRERAQAGA